MNPINTKCNLLILKADCIYSYHWALKYWSSCHSVSFNYMLHWFKCMNVWMNRCYFESITFSPIKQRKPRWPQVHFTSFTSLIACNRLRDIKFTGAFVATCSLIKVSCLVEVCVTAMFTLSHPEVCAGVVKIPTTCQNNSPCWQLSALRIVQVPIIETF
jgi:hypothetical protein